MGVWINWGLGGLQTPSFAQVSKSSSQLVSWNIAFNFDFG